MSEEANRVPWFSDMVTEQLLIEATRSDSKITHHLPLQYTQDQQRQARESLLAMGESRWQQLQIAGWSLTAIELIRNGMSAGRWPNFDLARETLLKEKNTND